MLSEKRLLCVDDDANICALVAALLSDLDVVSENYPASALRRAAFEQFDLILIDYLLPEGDGFELCKQIRMFNVKTPILFITAADSVTHEGAVAAGGQGVVRKDFLAQLLPAAIACAFEAAYSMKSPTLSQDN